MSRRFMAWMLGQDVIPSQAQAQPHKVAVPQIVTPLGNVSYPVVSPTGVMPDSVLLTTAIANPANDPMASQGIKQPQPLTIFGGTPEIQSNNAPGGL